MTADLARLAREALDQIGTFPDADMLRTGHAHSRADAAYIAAASPDVVLALLARVEALEDAIADVLEPQTNGSLAGAMLRAKRILHREPTP